MRIMPTRAIVATSIAAVMIVGLAGCGGGGTKIVAAQPPTGQTGSSADATAGSVQTAATADATGGTGNPFKDIRTAAMHMPETAETLAGGIAQATKAKGDPKSDGSTMRANLTYLFTEHVYLAGLAVATAYHAGAGSDAFKTASASVGANATDIEGAVANIVGADRAKPFVAAFDQHITDFVNYAIGAKTGGAKGKKMKDDALKALTGYAKAAGEFFSKNTGGALPAKTIENDTLTHIKTLAAAVDDFAAGKTSGYDKLKVAGDHMAGSAKVLAEGIAKATKMTGSPDDKVADTRASLTGALVSHVYLAGLAVFTAYADSGGVTGDQFKAAAGALDKNSVELSKAVGAVAGAKNEKTFLQVWRTHITNFVDYAKGDATNDEALKTRALKDLDGYRMTAGGFFNKITNGALPADAVASALKTHIETLAGAIDSLRKTLVTST